MSGSIDRRTSESPATAVAGVLLAAGLSSRMGTNKLLLEVGGEPLLRRSACAAVDAGLVPLVVVVGHEAERVRDALAGLDLRIVLNPDYTAGIATSIRAGVAALGAAAPAVVVLLADMPFVDSDAIRDVVARWRASGAPLVVSDYGGVDAPPILYDRRLFAELRAMDDGRCGKQVVRRHRDEAAVVVRPAATLADLDTPADVERAMVLLATH